MAVLNEMQIIYFNKNIINIATVLGWTKNICFICACTVMTDQRTSIELLTVSSEISTNDFYPPKL